MSTCLICYEPFNKPLCLPCGHLFCTECLVKTVQAIKPARNFHNCPVCRGTYSIVPVNPASIPMHLRPFVSPSVRRVYLDASSADPNSSSSPSPSPSSSSDNSEELARLRSENLTLRNHCVLWRRRAEVHGAATLGLLDFARMVRDQAVSLAQERDALKDQCRSLKRRLDDSFDQHALGSSQSAASSSSYLPTPAGPSTNNYRAFTFSCPMGRSTGATYPQATTSTTTASAPVDNSQLDAALVELQSCMNQALTSSSTQPTSSHRPYTGLGMHRYSPYVASSASSSAASSTLAHAQNPNRMTGPPSKRLRPTSGPSYPSVHIPSMGVPTTSLS